MELGLHIVRFDWPESAGSIADGLTKIGRTADDAGFTHLSVMDHYHQIGVIGPPEDPMLEGYLAALHLAHATTRARVGVLASGSQYRYPGLLVKIVTTLDVLSGGRALCILGAGWNEEESRGLGVPMPVRGERFARLEDTLRLAHQMFADNPAPFQGETLFADCPINHPLPLSRPRPPIMVAGGGEQRTLRLAAQYGDACNVFLAGPGSLEERAAGVAHKFEVLEGHCRDLGRVYDDIKRTALVTLPMAAGMTVPEVLETCRAASEAGVQELIVMLDEAHNLSHLEVLGAEVIPVIASW